MIYCIFGPKVFLLFLCRWALLIKLLFSNIRNFSRVMRVRYICMLAFMAKYTERPEQLVLPHHVMLSVILLPQEGFTRCPELDNELLIIWNSELNKPVFLTWFAVAFVLELSSVSTMLLSLLWLPEHLKSISSVAFFLLVFIFPLIITWY